MDQSIDIADDLGQAPALLQQTLAHSTEAMLVVDPSAHIVVANDSATRLFAGKDDGELVGCHIHQLLPAWLVDAPAEDGHPRAPVTLQRQDGSCFQARVHAAPIHAGPQRFTACYIRDITHEQRQQAHIHQLMLAVNESRNAILVCDAQSRITYVNPGFSEMFGYTLDEALGKLPGDILLGVDSDRQKAASIRAQRESGQPYTAEILSYTRDGRPFWVSIVANPIRDKSGAITHYVGIVSDITHTRIHQVLQHRVLEALVREAPLADVLAMMCHEVERLAPETIASVMRVDAYGKLRLLAAPSLPSGLFPLLDDLAIGPQSGPCGAAVWRGRAVVCGDLAADPACAGQHAAFVDHGLQAAWAYPVKSGNGQVLGVLAFHSRRPGLPNELHLRLIELCQHLCALALERESTRERVHQLAFYDTLTGLPNRMLFTARAEQSLAEAGRDAMPLAVLFVDIDRFKQINDTQGHAAGDSLLRDTAERLSQALGSECLIGRQASDEFVVLVPRADAEQIAVVSERLLASLSRPTAAGHLALHPSASIGIAMYPGDGNDIEALLRNADLAMYRAKLAGGNGYRFYSADMNRIVQESVALETALREALHHDQLHLCFQPQVEASGSHLLHGVEALVRWQHPLFGTVPPSRFIPIAEECGLIGEISRWVLRESCAQMAEWRRKGTGVPRISVNLSPINFQEPGLPAQVSKLLDQFHLVPGDLALELTEGVMLIADPVVMDNLNAIHQMGVHLSIDDFGTGYSSLSHLHQLPIDEIKLDMSFVRDLEHSESARALTTSVLQLGSTLKKTVVAEGVETANQRDFLAGLDCDVLQGYLFSKPLPPEPFEHWLAQRQAPQDVRLPLA